MSIINLYFKRSSIKTYLIFPLVLAAALLAALCIGRYPVSIPDVVGALFNLEVSDPRAVAAVQNVRLPRVIMAAIIGAGLSVSGVSLQAMFGNPLVSSHILGVSASAGFGAALGILFFSQFWAIQFSAVIFGFLGMFCAYSMGKRKGQIHILMLVLAGVIVGAVFEALTSLIKYVADPEEKLPAITYWLMGSLSSTSYSDIYTSGPAILLGTAVLWIIRWQMNVISLREDEAVSLGVNLKRIRVIIVVASTIIAAVTVAACGVISFVGLAVPHFARMIVGNDHRKLMTASIFLGAAFLVLIDTAARSITAAEIPLSILTATIGAPFFAILLRRTGGGWND